MRATLSTLCVTAVFLASGLGWGVGETSASSSWSAESCPTLREGSPEELGLDSTPLVETADRLRRWAEPATGRPLFAGAAVLYAHQNVVLRRDSAGYALRYADGEGRELPGEEQRPAGTGTVFDIASLSKLFTSVLVMRQVEEGALLLDAPVSRYVPEFGDNGKERVTLRQLLTHTSGLEPFLPLWRDWPDRESRLRAVLAVRPQVPPGSAYVYSDLNMIALMVVLERVTGLPLDELLRRDVTEPLGLAGTGFRNADDPVGDVAATEYQVVPARGMVHGEVHDENAWSLGGVSGHAGMFSTIDDLAVFGQTMLNGGCYGGARILRPSTVRQMLTNHNDAFPSNPRGLGFELDQPFYMGGLSGPLTAGHTGYTGTSLVLDPLSNSVVVLLTNRVHPSRDWGSINPARAAVSDALASVVGRGDGNSP
ncbi:MULTISPECIES: serine hydrolase domain-containing protein [Actinoalloteichus]|uniref:serine hydrolase domain-containing protein n=1 Tax=Actinoalloteichus TaxID=65496 RepID=UPI0026974CA7